MAKTKNEVREALKKELLAKQSMKAAKGVVKKATVAVLKKRLSDQATATKKPHRFRSGTRALMEIRKYQRANKFAWITLIPKVVVFRLIKETVAELDTTKNYKLKRKAAINMHQAFEMELVKQMQCANMVAIHAGRTEVAAKDFEAANLIRANHSGRPITLTGWAIKGKRVRKQRARQAAAKKQPVAAKKVFEAGQAVKQARKAPQAKPAASFGDDDEAPSDEEAVEEEEEEEAMGSSEQQVTAV
jgi:histone H3